MSNLELMIFLVDRRIEQNVGRGCLDTGRVHRSDILIIVFIPLFIDLTVTISRVMSAFQSAEMIANSVQIIPLILIQLSFAASSELSEIVLTQLEVDHILLLLETS